MKKINEIVRPPYLGVAYYPEDWPRAQMDYDIAMMRKAGVTVARIGEFAWHKMEPREGEYDFAWLHEVVDKLATAGIAVVMGTPTATPPRWLTKKHPDMLTVNAAGVQTTHGGRRHCCSNNPHYREYSRKIVEAQAREFGDDPAVIGWQIDNEIYAWNGGCCCEHCVRAFHDKLQQKFGDIDALNERWNLNLFSQWYDDFADIPAPGRAWNNPHLIMEWNIFQNESHVDFVHMQADILHKYVSVPVGTDTMPFNGMDYREMTRKLDICQFNHYNVPKNLYAEALWFDYLRTLKPDQPFWNTETATCWNGSTAITQSIKPEGYNRVNSWLPIALGGEANMYWLWRTHWAGHELMHGAVIDTTGRPMHTFTEVQDVAASFQKAADFINHSRVRTDVALHFTSLNWNMQAAQNVVEGLNYMDALNRYFYKPIVDSGLRPDVIDAAEDLARYKLIFSPMMMTLEEHGLPERLAEWVKAGGTWVVGPLSDIRNADGARFTEDYFGMLEKLTGVKMRYFAPDRERRVGAIWQDGEPLSGDFWYDFYDAADADALAVCAKGHSALEGQAVVARKKVGLGEVILLGTFPDEASMKKLIAAACADAGVDFGRVEGQVMVSPRGGEREGLILVEYGCEPAAYALKEPMRDVLTGVVKQGCVELKPYEVLVLEKV